MGWKQYLRHVEAASRRHQRELTRHYRALEKERRHVEKEMQRQAAETEVEEFERYVKLLVGVHIDCGPTWDWRAIPSTPPPAAPEPTARNEQAARVALEGYRPGFFEKLFGGAKKRLAELERLLVQAQAADQQEHAAAMNEHASLLAHWNESHRLCPGVLRLESNACAAALRHAAAYDDLAAFGITVRLDAIAGDVAVVTCTVNSDEAVPTEEVKLTAGGKLSTKEMAQGKYWTLYQDHVCSCAIRAARETFAVLPVRRLIVNMCAVRLNPSTGHVEPQPVLGVHFTSEQLAKLRLGSIDPTDSMKNFPHRMKFKKTTGLETIEPLGVEEQWVTT